MRIPDKLRAAWPTLFVLVLLPAILYWPFLFGNRALFWGTPLLQFWPWRQFAVDELRAGRLPLWNPYAGCGVPLLADHQSALFYPPNLLALILPVEQSMGISLFLHAILAGLAMAAFIRELGRSRLAATIGASAFMLSGYVVSRGSFLTEVNAIAWLPLLWLYGGRTLAPGKPRRSRLRALLALAAVIALQFLAGHAQTWFFSLVSLALYGLWLVGTGLPPLSPPRKAHGEEEEGPTHQADLLTLPRGSCEGGVEKGLLFAIRSAMTRYLLLGAAVAWGTALAAIQFLPTMELSQLAQRSGDPSWEPYALQYSMWPWRLITLLMPDFFGNPARGTYWGYATYWEDAGYVGVLPFALALLALLAWARRRWKRAPAKVQAPETVPFALLALFSLLMALGKNTPFYLFFYRHVPGFGQFQAPARWLCIYTGAVAVLAAVGLDALRPSRAVTFAGRLSLVAAVQAALLAWLATTEPVTNAFADAGLPDVKPTFARALLRFSILAAATLILLLWQQRRLKNAARDTPGRSRQLQKLVWPAAALLLVAGDLIYAGYALNPAVDAALYDRPTETGTAIAADGPRGRLYYSAESREEVLFGRYLDFEDYRSHLRGAERLKTWWGLREALIPDLAMVERLPSANTFEPLVQARYRHLLEALDQADPQVALRTLGLMNVAYLFGPNPPPTAPTVHRAPDVAVYRNPEVRPRAYVAYRAIVADSPDHALSLLLSPTFDPTTVLLEHPAFPIPQSPTPQPPSGPSQNPILLPSPANQATIQVTLAQPGYLVLMDTFYPGWRATVDGRAAEITRANYAFRAIALEAGAHEVVLRYRPRSLLTGAIVSGTALIALVAALVVRSLRKDSP